MPTIIDLTMPIVDHVRWPVERKLQGDFTQGDPFQITWIGWAVHGFTHMDAPRHMLPDGKTTSDIPLETVIGTCAVFDLSGIAANTPISPQMLADANPTVRSGDIALFKTEWDVRYSYATTDFWTQAPYMTRDAAQWLLAQGIKAAAFDFPQDYVIRLLLDGTVAPMEEFVTHDVLLRNEVILVEYLCNTKQVTSPRTQLYVLPLKIPHADGAPARVIAVEEVRET